MKSKITKILGFANQDSLDGEIKLLDIESIRVNPFQPRKVIDNQQLNELANSIRDVGLIQPILVRKTEVGYEVVAGERRLRASKLAGLKKIPAVIKMLNDKETAEIALIENLQREDLNYFEEAEGYMRLIAEFDFTQEELAAKLGRTQSSIANKLRLLKLSPAVREAIDPKRISERHCRALLALPGDQEQLNVIKSIYENDLTVRQTEELINKILQNISREIKKKPEEKKVLKVIKDIRIVLNSIRGAVKTLKDAGLNAEMEENDRGEFIEVVIKFPKQTKDEF